MAYTKKKLSDCIQLLADLHDAGKVPTGTTQKSLWIRHINAGINYCASRIGVKTSGNFTTVSGSVALPDSFVSVDMVFLSSGIELKKLAHKEAIGVTGNYYYISGDYFNGYNLVILTGTDDTITMFYKFRVEEISADSDICKIPDFEAPVFYAYSRLRDSETDPIEDSKKYMGLCEDRIKQMKSDKEENELDFVIKIQQNA